MRRIISFLCLGAFVFLAQTAYAAEFIKPSNENPNVSVSASQTHKNLYTAGATVTLNGSIQDDLFAAGGMVTLSGEVQKDAGLAGGTIVLDGKVGENAWVAGGNITINAPVGGDLFIGGGNVTITEKASIGGDLIAAGGNLVLNAAVRGNVKIAGGNIAINSTINGDVNIIAGSNKKNQGNLTFEPGAVVLGKIVYKGPREAIVKPGAKVGNIDYTKINISTGKKYTAFFAIGFLIKLAALIIAGLLLVRFKKNWIIKIQENMRLRPWPSLGWGFAGIIVAPVLMLVLFISLVGYYLGFFLGASLVLAALLAHLAAALIVGSFVYKYLTKAGGFDANWQTVVLGVVIYCLLAALPFIGWLITAILCLMAFGSILSSLKEGIKKA